jgi:hypothetical protein
MTPEQTHLRTVMNQDGAAILDASRNRITTLNSTGAFVWGMLLEGHDHCEIVASLAQRCDVAPDIVEQGVRSFVADLKDHSLLPMKRSTLG